ncbi:hypothetical protein [Azospirillum thermophilum]|nr:hypothetical protein [Azospirillum thermophilum]
MPQHRSTPPGRFAGRLRRLTALMLLAGLVLPVLVLAPAARAAEEPGPAPRVSLTVGGVGVVLIAANRQLYAFLDRTADNAPVTGGRVGVKAGRTELQLAESSPGVYVGGPFAPTAPRVALTVSIDTAAGSGRAAAEIEMAHVPVQSGGGGALRLLGWVLGLASAGGIGWFGWRQWHGRRRGLADAGPA